MRKVIVAALALSPMLLHAQANLPAQPSVSSNVLVAKVAGSHEFGAPAANPTTHIPLRISSGVIAPKLIHTVVISSAGDSAWKAAKVDRTVVVKMLVDETGKPTNLKITHPLSPIMDQNILEAVSRYRFKPGTLDNQPTTVPVSLEITLRPGE